MYNDYDYGENEWYEHVYGMSKKGRLGRIVFGSFYDEGPTVAFHPPGIWARLRFAVALAFCSNLDTHRWSSPSFIDPRRVRLLMLLRFVVDTAPASSSGPNGSNVCLLCWVRSARALSLRCRCLRRLRMECCRLGGTRIRARSSSPTSSSSVL